MNGILGMTELMMDTNLKGEQKEYMLIIRESANSLLKLLNDILDFSKVEAGHVDFETIDFELPPLIDAVLDSVTHLSTGLDVEFVPMIHRDVPDWLRGDPARLRQVMTNLVGNAAKFTHEGQVVVDVRKSGDTEEGITLKFSVSDTGVGISEDKLEAIFESFTQADGSTTRQYGGTGLGLAISRKLVAMMGGRISVQSSPGKGSTFSFVIKLGHSTIGQQTVTAGLKGRRVLVVNENASVRNALSEMFIRIGMDPVDARDLEGALDILGQAHRPFDLLVADSLRSSRSGQAYLKSILSHPRLSGGRVILLSDGAYSSDNAILQELPPDSFMRKPMKISGFKRKLVNLFGKDEAEEGKGRGLPRTGGKFRILLAEDNEVNQRVAEKVLERSGHEVVTVTDGRLAVEALQREGFDLILMDLQMPEMDGFQATEIIRNSTIKGIDRDIPIIALTAHALLGDIDNCLRAGMNGFMAKPFRSEELLREIDNVMSGQSEWVVSPDLRDANSVVENVLDMDNALDRLDGDKELLDEICRYFIEMGHEQMTRISEASENNDTGTIRREAHSMKSASASVGAMRLYETSRTVEMIAAGDASESLSNAMDQLKLDFTDAIEALRSFIKNP